MDELVAGSMVTTVEKIGRYEIVGELGRGAMGLVYRAIDPNIGRTVALKTLRLDVGGLEHDELIRRFRYEARAAGLMNHPNIVTIYDADEVDGLFYIAMEYLEGETLQALMMENRVLSAERIVDITRQVAAGLDYAHQMKVIHRDIKPANIMITRQNVAKIMDFGISKAAGNMTSGSQVLGTPNYMSPEQVRGHELDGRADLFSFGVVLYEMATGERPFAAQNVTTIIYKIINENPIAPGELEMTLHPGMSAVISKCLTKNPNDRYQSGAELVRDMDNYRSLGSDGDITSVLPPMPEVATTQSIQKTNNASTGIGSGSQGAAVAPALATQSSATKTAPVAAASAVANPRKAPVTLLVLIVLAIVAAGATLYQLRHRQHGIAQKPSEPALSVATTVPDKQSSNPQQTSPGQAHSVDSKPAVTPASDTKAPAKTPVKKPAEHAAEPASVAGKVEIRFTSNPAGAFVQIDGKSSSAWLTPFTISELAPGTHQVIFTKQGYSIETRKLEIGPKNSSYNLDLVQMTTALSVNSDPPGASIEIDGRDTNKVTPAQIPVAEGDHKIVLRLDGYHSAGTQATVTKGQIFSFFPTLNPGDARQAGNTNPVTNRLGKIFGGGFRGGKGMIDFVTTPPGAKIYIQGRAMAFATPAHVPIPEGDYRIEFREPGYKPVQQNVHVEAGKNSRVVVTLDPQ